jgi:hypothetical protein
MTPWSLENLKNNWVFHKYCREQILPRLSSNIQDQDVPIVPTADGLRPHYGGRVHKCVVQGDPLLFSIFFPPGFQWSFRRHFYILIYRFYKRNPGDVFIEFSPTGFL